MFKSTPRFHMERLEDRQMMAGDVHASFSNGTLFLNEAVGHVGGHQTVQITHLSNGNVRLNGLTSPSNPTGTLINGQRELVFSFPSGFNIQTNLGAGRDAVHVFGNSTRSLPGSLIINTGAPSGSPNDVDIVNVNDMVVGGRIEVNTGSGADNVRLRNCNAAGDMTIRAGTDTPAGLSDSDEVIVNGTRGSRSLLITTGEGNDVVTVKNVNFPIGAQGGHITINAGAGADAINLGSVPNVLETGPGPALENFGPVTLGGGVHIVAGTDLQNDIDTVKMQDVFVDGHTVVELGNGNDTLDMLNVSAKKFISLAGQKGNDTIKMTEVQTLDSVFASLGEGDDTLDMTFVKAQAMTLDGGLGTNDKLRRSQMPFIPSVTLKGWEEIDGKRVLTVAPGIVGLPRLQLSPV